MGRVKKASAATTIPINTDHVRTLAHERHGSGCGTVSVGLGVCKTSGGRNTTNTINTTTNVKTLNVAML